MKKAIIVAGARPNFMKIAPILRTADQQSDFEMILVHTGQHYDENMSGSFFTSFGIRAPDYSLTSGSGSHAAQTAEIMIGFEKVCLDENPDMVIVVGDVNSTIAAGLVAKKLHKQLVHIEAGLRSFDRNMPEEINRIATDAITDLFFTTEAQGGQNLIKEGHLRDQIHFVGNVMIDNLFYQLNRLHVDSLRPLIRDFKQKLPEKYFCLTLHRPSNVDSKEVLSRIIKTLNDISKDIPVLFSCHPRTRNNIDQFGLDELVQNAEQTENPSSGIFIFDPLPYDEFLFLWKDATAVLTDSGGLQEETTALGIPCLTIRENTERPITLNQGSNTLVGSDSKLIKKEIEKLKKGEGKSGKIPDLWDGKASDRIVDVIKKTI
jgi:UDP-N-acetylglucosamine 2-epimerase (non-hydrolysing)